MDKRNDIVSSAEAVFDGNGFRGTGIDAVLAPSGTSTRTLYKHFGSRDGLVVAVLDRRHRLFMERLAADSSPSGPVAALFDTLSAWVDERGAGGCMLLRARAEYAQANADIVALVARHKTEFEEEVARRVTAALGRPDTLLARQIWMLFEGATATAALVGGGCVEAAKAAAVALLGLARDAAR